MTWSSKQEIKTKDNSLLTLNHKINTLNIKTKNKKLNNFYMLKVDGSKEF